MVEKSRIICGALLMAALFTVGAASPAIAQDAAWHVSKASGEFWLATAEVQKAALESDAVLKPGDMIHTGANGRVLLTRGAETMLISANSVVGIPMPKPTDTMPTTILQQAGSILLEVEKQNVQHFEVATPYLAAVVKGTQFRVTVDGMTSRVDVIRGQVQVTDYKTGQRALINKDQTASVSVQGSPGLSLSGSGPMNPIELGAPRSPAIAPITLPTTASGSAAARTHDEAQQAQATPPARQPEWSRSNDYKDTGWAGAAMTWGKDFLNFNGKKNNDNDMTIIAIPVVIGLSATVGAIALRRKKKPAQKPNGR